MKNKSFLLIFQLILFLTIHAQADVKSEFSESKQSTDFRKKAMELWKKALYPQSVQCWPAMTTESKIFEPALADLKVIIGDFLTEEEFARFAQRVKERGLEGTCYGEAFTFLLLNGPDEETIRFPILEEDKKKVAIFQARYSNLFFEEFKQRGIALVQKFYPDLPSTIKLEKECPTYLDKISKAQVSNPQKEVLEELAILENLLDKNIMLKKMIENHVLSTLLHAGLKPLPAIKILREKKTVDDFIIAFLDNFLALPRDTLVELFVELQYENGPGHGILIQPYRKRIYDAQAGIYEYDSLKSLLQDFLNNLSTRKGTTSVSLHPFVYKEI